MRMFIWVGSRLSKSLATCADASKPATSLATLVLAFKADAHRNKQNRRTAKAFFAQIKAGGYTGCYSRVTDFIREWRVSEGKTPHAFVPLMFEHGEAFQFDWSDEGLVVGGIYYKRKRLGAAP
jgi:hypothetical protein